MNKALRELLDQVGSVPDFIGIELRDINDTNAFGDNALHCVCVWGDLDAARLLVAGGINIEQQGEGGFTPLKVADEFGHTEMVSYLLAMGANPDALQAKFQFNPEADARHMKSLRIGIEALEKNRNGTRPNSLAGASNR